MNYPPIFAICAADATVVSLIGDSSALRFFPFGNAPQNELKPYAVFQTTSGIPENYLGNRPNIEQWTVTVECYAKTIDTVRQVAAAIRDAIETECHITGWRSEEYDSTTGLYSMAFDSDWFVKRIVPPAPPVLGYPLDDDGTVAALFGYGTLSTTAPDYVLAEYTYTENATGALALALPNSANVFSPPQMLTVTADDILSVEAEIVGISAAFFDPLTLGILHSVNGTPAGTTSVYVANDEFGGNILGGTGVYASERTAPITSFRIGIDLIGPTGQIRIKSSDGIQLSLATFTPPLTATIYLSVQDSGTTTAGETVSMRLIVPSDDYTLPCPSGAKNLTGDTIP